MNSLKFSSFLNPIFQIFFGLFFLVSCQNKTKTNAEKSENINEIKYATGLSIENYDDFTLVKVQNLWPESNVAFQYVLHKNGITLPDSLKSVPAIEIPIKSVIVTSTTHIPSLTLLNVETSLVGFPGLDYISSQKVRTLISEGKVREVGSNMSLNTEVIVDMQPSVVVVFGVSVQQNSHKTIENAGIDLVYHADWMEQNPLGRAEWIKLFGALFDQQEKAQSIFDQIESDYLKAKSLAAKANYKPTVMSGAIYEDQWYLPHGNSWAAQFLKDANANYLWANSSGNGSLALSYESVLEKAQNADFWLGPAQFTSYKSLFESNSNYQYFKPFNSKKIYTFSGKKGQTGGVIYYEEASARPDLVLKDLIKILHPSLQTDHELYFFEPLK